MSQAIIEKAPAKVNLFLHVLGKRADGYHNLESLICFTGLADEIIAEPDKSFSFNAKGEFAKNIESWDNSVIKTYKIFSEIAAANKIDTPHFKITLNKNIPVGAGLGGGSADAAAVMRLLIREWKIKLTESQAERIALAIGADIPACYHSKPLFIKNIGDIDLKLKSFPAIPVVFANPQIMLPTSEVFKKYNGAYSQTTNKNDSYEYAEAFSFIKSCKNDLEKTAISLKIEISDVLHALGKEKGVIEKRMTGSGSTCFAIFESSRTAEEAAKNISAKNKGWWVKNTTILGT